ncbi:hypothetical protein WME98_50120 [Sorangium sp. So ce296]|uniref:hypothetical protein n=1 Tax=Sorangium sp. So ce296 TaxID=3133296 RepID=UPI003F6205FF
MPARNAAGSHRPPSARTTRRARQGRPAPAAPRSTRAAHAFPHIEARSTLPLGTVSLDCARLDDGRVVLLGAAARGLLGKLVAERPRRGACLPVEVVDEHGEVHVGFDAGALIASGVYLATGILIAGEGAVAAASDVAAARFLDVLTELASTGVLRLLEAA